MMNSRYYQLMIILIVISSLLSACSPCPTAKYLDNSTNLCQPCLSNCISCVSSSACLRCSSSYYINGGSCRMCIDSYCQCNGVSFKCEITSNAAQIFAYVALPICALFVIVVLLCFIIKWCRSGEQLNPNADVSNEEFIRYAEPNKNNLGILATVMKNRWTQDHIPDTIENSSICAICLGEECQIKTNCNHAYHVKCLFHWSRQKIICPVCKRDNISEVRKFCQNCRKSYIKTKLKDLNQFAAQFLFICSQCKAQKNKRLDSLCEMDLNEFQ